MGFTVDCNTLSRLIEQYLQGTIAPEEQALLDEWYTSFDKAPNLSLPDVTQPSVAFADLKKMLGLQNAVAVKRETATS